MKQLVAWLWITSVTEELAASLLTVCNKPANNLRPVVWGEQLATSLLTTYNKSVDNLQQVCWQLASDLSRQADASTDLIVDWIEQQCAVLASQNEAGTSILCVPGSKFMQQRTMWRTIAKHDFMHEFMFRYCRSHCSLLHKITSGYPKDACSGFILRVSLLYPVYYEISGCRPCERIWYKLDSTSCNKPAADLLQLGRF